MMATAAGVGTLGVLIGLEGFRKAIALREGDNPVKPGS